MWRLLGLGGHPLPISWSYQEASTDPEDTDEPTARHPRRETVPLDIIEVAGVCSTSVLQAWTFPYAWFQRATSMLGSADRFLRETELKEAHSDPQTTQRRYSRSVSLLTSWNVLRESTEHVLRIFGSYFEVAKSNLLNRAIINARMANSLARRPPRFRLARFMDIVRLISRHSAFATSDLRHWFFQLKLPVGVERLFSISLNNRIFEFRVVPMGFSWAPLIAQSICTGLVCRGQRWSVMSSQTEETPPPVSSFTDKKGKEMAAAICIYDNVLIGAKNTSIRDSMLGRFRSNCNDAGVVIKESSINQEPQFMGVQFWKADHVTYWRHLQTNIDRWRKAHTVIHGGDRRRVDVMRIIGVILWDYTVRNAPFCEAAEVIDILRRVCSSIHSKDQWNEIIPVTTEERVTLSEAMERVLCNIPFIFCTSSNRQRGFISL